jgi:hypothetical protein
MSRLEKVALATAILAALLGVMGVRSPAYQYYVDQLLPGSLAVGVLGWTVATYGPLALAVTFRRLTTHLRTPPLVLHLLFLPCALAFFWAGYATMAALIIDPDFDALLGFPETPALFSLAVATVGYFVSALSERRPAKTKQVDPESE